MDSQWFHMQTRNGLVPQDGNGYRRMNAGNTVDLTLRLGLPYYDELPNHDHQLSMADHHFPATSHYPNIISHQCHYSDQGRNQYEVGNYGSWNINGGWCGCMKCSELGHFAAGSSVGVPSYNGYYKNYVAHPAASMLPVNNNAIIDCFSSRTLEFELGNSSSSHKKYHDTNPVDPEKRCTKCNNDDTPMWRKGPLGPKSLCNACGIKYRKDLERMKIGEISGNWS